MAPILSYSHVITRDLGVKRGGGLFVVVNWLNIKYFNNPLPLT